MSDPRNRVLDALKAPGYGLRIVKKTQYDHDFWNGRLLVWEPPERGHRYVLGIDVAEGVGRDRTIVEVLRVGDRKRPDEQVAEWASDYHSPYEVSPIINTIGRWYKEDDGTEAQIIIEVNTASSGDAIAHDLRYRLDYSNFWIWKIYDKVKNIQSNRLGWWTNPSTRRKLLARGQHGIARNDLTLNSEFLLQELADFVSDFWRAKAQARSGTHDDRVMALFMAYWAAHDDELLAGEDIAEERRLLAIAADTLQTGVDDQGSTGVVKPDYFNSPVMLKPDGSLGAMTLERMMESWDSILDD